MHICGSKLTIIVSDNGLLPGRCQAIIWTNAGILLIGPLGTNSSDFFIKIHTFSFKKMHLKRSSGKWRPFCLGLTVLNTSPIHRTDTGSPLWLQMAWHLMIINMFRQWGDFLFYKISSAINTSWAKTGIFLVNYLAIQPCRNTISHQEVFQLHVLYHCGGMISNSDILSMFPYKISSVWGLIISTLFICCDHIIAPSRPSKAFLIIGWGSSFIVNLTSGNTGQWAGNLNLYSSFQEESYVYGSCDFPPCRHSIGHSLL